MHVFILSDLSSPHTERWVTSLCSRGLRVSVFSIGKYDENVYEGLSGFRAYQGNIPQSVIKKYGTLGKVSYFLLLPQLYRLLNELRPDVIHAHRISSNGFFASLVSAHPLLVSAWGNDVYLFPRKSALHRWITTFALKRADVILSTSKVMAKQLAEFTKKPIYETPFGVDTDLFFPNAEEREDSRILTVGTIKTMEPIYGVDTLIKAFALLCSQSSADLRLLLVGGGSYLQEYKLLSESLGIGDRTTFTGRVPFSRVPDYHRQIDIFVALSNFESFGVSIIEAGACGKPVVVSDAEGPSEVVVHNRTGLIVPKQNPEAAAAAMQELVDDKNLRERMGRAGHQHVIDKYDWKDNVGLMISIYRAAMRNPAKMPLPPVANLYRQ